MLSSANLDVTRVTLQLALLYSLVEQVRAAVQPRSQAGLGDSSELPSVVGADAEAAQVGSDDGFASERLGTMPSAAPADGDLLDPSAAAAQLRDLIEEELGVTAQARGLTNEEFAAIDREQPGSAQAAADGGLAGPVESATKPVGSGLPSFGDGFMQSHFAAFGGVVMGGLSLALSGGASAGTIVTHVALNAVGIVADGYISGATVKLLDAHGRVLATTTTDATGKYEFNAELLKQATQIWASGGKDISTGLDFKVDLRAPATSIVVNPLTTLVQSYLDANPGTSAEAASAAVKKALGIANSVNLLTTDPISLAGSLSGAEQQQALELQVKAAQIANLLVSGAAALMSCNAYLTLDVAMNSILAQLTGQIALAASQSSVSTLSLSDSELIADVFAGSVQALNDAALVGTVLGLSDAAVALIAAGNSIHTSSLLSLYEFQKVVQDDLAQALSLGSSSPQFAQAVQAITALLNVVAGGQKVVDVTLAPSSDTGLDAGDRLTNIANPQVRVDLASVVGTVKEGYVVKLLLEGNLVPYVTAPVTAVDIRNGYLDFTLPNFTASGSKTISIVIADGVDSANRTAVDVASGFLAVSYDKDAAAISGALDLDTGLSGSDNVTSSAAFTIAGLEAGAVWQYKVVGGEWSQQVTGLAVMLDVPDGAVTVLLRQIDKAGNQSADTSFHFVLDRQANAVGVSLANDTGRTGGGLGLLSDRITSVGDLSITGAETGAAVQVSADNGTTWVALNQFAAQEGANDILVRQTDLAGNVSATSSLQFTLDTQAAAPNAALSHDTGVAGDRLTSDATLSVTNTEAAALVQYSINGTDWSNSFNAAEGANTVYVRQIDAVGNVSAASAPLSFTLDTTAATGLSVRLASDTGNSSTDGLTRNGTVNVSGVESGAKWFYSTDAGAHWTQGTDSAFALTGDGAKSVLVRQQDAAGNYSANVSLGFTIDTSRPGAPSVVLSRDTGSSNADNITSNATLTASGQETGAVVEYSINGTNWSSSFGASEGLNTVYVRQTDVAGNVSESGQITFTLDTLAPASPGVALRSDTGKSGSDLITNNGALNVTADSGAVVEVSVNGGATWKPLSDFAAISGANTVLVRQTDAAGNISTPATQLQFTLDTTVQAPTLGLAIDSGTSATDKLTNQGLINVSGIESGASWEFTKAKWDGAKWVPLNGANAVASADVWQSGTGSSLTVANLLTDDAVKYRVFVRQTDAAGNVNTSSAFDFTLDTQAAAPTVALATDTAGPTSDATLSVTNTEAAALVQYSINGTDWSNSFNAAEGANTVYVRQIDAVGNVSAASAPLSFTLDTTAATGLSVRLASDTGNSSTDGLTRNGTVNVSGVESGAKWFYSTDAGAHWTQGTDSAFALTGDGAKSVLVRQQDAAGNYSANVSLGFSIDTSRPGAPSVVLSRDTGSSNADNITSNATLTASGQETGAVVEYSINGTNWSSSFGASEGLNTVYVRQTDVAGNVSESGQLTFTLDTLAPGSPGVALESDTGKTGSDLITNNGALNVTADSGAVVEVSVNDGATWKPLSDFAAISGANTVLVRQTDAAGNISTPATQLRFTLDATVEALGVSLANDTGRTGGGLGLLSDRITSVGDLSITGAETGAAVQVSADNGATWVVLDQFAAQEGANDILVRQTDLAGNVSATSSLQFTLDTQTAAPNAALSNDTGVAGDRLTSDATLSVTNTESAALVQYSINGTDWSNSFNAAEGANTVYVRQIDAVGNVSAASAPLSFTLDTTAATGLSLRLASDTGSSSTDGLTRNGTVNVSGVESGAKWFYSTDAGAHWTQGTDSAFALTGDGAKSVLVRQQDAAGNYSANVSLGFTIDTSRPGAPSVVLSRDTGSSLVDNITNLGSLTTTGQELGAVVEYRVDGSDTWSSSFGASEGLNTVYVRQTDVAGNVSESGQITFTLDTLAPASPGVALRGDTGKSDSDLITNNGALNVTADSGAVVEVSVNGGATWKPLSDFAAISGANTVLVRQTDAAGNISTPATQLQFTLDTTVQAPTLGLAIDSGTSATDKLTNQGLINVSGIESGASWEFTKAKWDGAKWVPLNGANAVASADVWQSGTGSSLTVANLLTDDAVKYRVFVRQTDAAGNVNTSSAFDFTLDTKAAAPTIALATDSGTAGDALTNVGTVNVGGLEAGATWKYSTNGGVTWTAGKGSSVALTGDGTKNVLVRQTDSAGNTSSSSTALGFKLDTQVAAPTLKLASDTGASASDLITKTAGFTVGALEGAGTTSAATVQYSNDKVNWSSSYSPTQGSNTVYARQVDAAGNISSATSALVFTYDTVAPTLNVGTLAGDGVLSSSEALRSLLITGTTDAQYGQTVSLKLNGKLYTGTVAAGTWSVLVPQADVAALTPGTNYGLTDVTVSDLAGNAITLLNTATDDPLNPIVLAVAAAGGGSDGYISGAVVFADKNNDGVLGAGEATSLTDAVGNFSLPANGNLVMRGGVDVSTGLAFQSQYEAPTGYRVINPITTLVINKTGLTVEGAESWTKAALFGVGAGTSVTLGTYDPLRAATETNATTDARTQAVSYQKVALELSNIMDVGSMFLQNLKAPGLTAADALTLRQEYSVSLIAKVAQLLPAETLLSTQLANADFVKSVLDGVASDYGITGAAAGVKIHYLGDVLAAANSAIDAVTGLVDTSRAAIALLQDAIKVQSATQGDISDSLEAYAKGGAQPGILVANAATHLTPLEQAIADAVTGVIVPARVSIDSAHSTSTDGLLEGAAGATTAFNITLTRSGNIDCVVTLNYSLATGAGVSASDFAGNVIPGGNVTFASGQETLTLTIMVQGDDIKELTENFSVILTDPLGQTQLIDASGNAATALTRGFDIVNDDPLVPTFGLPDAIELVAGEVTDVHGVSLDYYKTDVDLTLKVKSVMGVELYTTVDGVTTSSVSDGAHSVLTLTGTLASIQAQLAALQVSVPATETSAYLAFEAVETAGASSAQGLADIALGLHHVASIDVPTSLPTLLAGQETALSGFQVSDLDNNTLTVRLTPVGGLLGVSVLPTGLGLIQEDDGGLTLTGTPLAVNLALDSLTITAVAGDVSISATVSDGDALTNDRAAVTTAGSAAAAPTTLTVPDGLTVSAGYLTGVSGIEVSDIDSDQLTLSLTATGGVLDFAVDLDALAVLRTNTVVNGVATITLTGDKADLNAALDSLTFKAARDVTAGTITVHADDGVDASAAFTRSINVTIAQNDPPEAGGAILLAAQTEDAAASITISGLHLVNPDGDAPNAVRIVSITGGSLSYSSKPITLGLAGDILPLGADGKLVLDLALNANFASNVKISYVVVDPIDTRINSLPSTITVPVNAVNDAPVIAPNGLSYSFTEGAAPVEILKGLTVTDVDSAMLSSARIVISSGLDSSDLLSVTLPSGSGLTSSYVGGVLTLSGAATLADYQSALRSVTFSNGSDNPSTAARQIAVTVTDSSGDAGTQNSLAIARTVTVVAVNDAPTITKAGGDLPSATEQTSLSLAGLGIAVGDVDAGSNAIKVTLTVGAGQINALAGASGVAVTGSGTATVTLTGTVGAIGDILSGQQGALAYLNTSDNPAARDQLTVSVNDGGANGLGGALTAQASYQFSVLSVNDLPVISLSSSGSAQALYAATVGTTLLAPQVSVSDVDSSGFVAARVEITTGLQGTDTLYLSAAATQTLASANFSAVYADGVLKITQNDASRPMAQADLEAVLRGVSFTTTGTVVDGETRVVVYSVVDNTAVLNQDKTQNIAASTSAATSVTLTLQQAPFAAVQTVGAVQTLVFTGDPKTSAISADLTTFRVLANGAAVSISGGNLFAVRDIDASAATQVAVSLVGSSAANRLTGSALGDTLTGGGGLDVLTGGAGDDTFVVGALNGVSELSAMASLAGGSGTDTIRLVSAQSLTQTEWTKISGIERISLAGDQGVYALTLGANAAASFSSVLEVTGQGLQSAALDLSAAGYTGSLRVTGTDTVDTIKLGAGDDTVSAGAGADTITGGAGLDTLSGGAGADTFVFGAGDTGNSEAGADRITDLQIGDRLNFSGLINGTSVTSISLTTVADAGHNYLNVKSQTGASLAFIDLGTAAVPGDLNSWTQVGGLFTVADNASPVWTVPFTTAVQRLTLGASGSAQAISGLSVADTDASLTVTVQAVGGTLSTLAGFSGIKAVYPDGAASGASLSLTGTAAEINAALAALRYVAPGAGPGQITLSVNDHFAGHADVNSVVYLTTPNSKPVALNDAVVATEDSTAAVSGSVKTNDSLGDGTASEHTVAWGAQAPSYGSVVLRADGSYSYTLNNNLAAVQQLAPGQSLTETFKYTVSDKDGDASSSTLVITIRGADDLTVARPDATSLSEDSKLAVTGSVRTNDTLGDGTVAQNTIAWGAEAAQYGVLVHNADGSYSYRLKTAEEDPVAYQKVQALMAGQHLTETFSYTLTDSNNSASSNVLSITIDGANDTPVAVGDSLAIFEEADASVATPPFLGNVKLNDALGDAVLADSTVTWEGVDASYGTLLANADGTYSYTLNHNLAIVQQLLKGQSLVERFSYTLRDSDNQTSSQTLTITINGADHPTVVGGVISASVSEGNAAQSASGALTARDMFGEAALFQAQSSVVGNSGYGSFSVGADGKWVYALNGAHDEFVAGQKYTDSFTVRTVDGIAQTVTVTITGTNDAPTLSDTPLVLAAGTEDTAYTVTAQDLLKGYSDVEGDSLSVSALSADHASVKDNGNGTFTITPAQDYNGALNLSYNVVDGKGGSIAASQSVNLSSVNDAPALSGQTVALAVGIEDTTYTVTAADLLKGYSDVEGDSLSVSALSADHASVKDNGNGTFTITPAQDYNGALNLSYQVLDSKGGSIAASQTVSLSSVNDAPVLSGQTAALAGGPEDKAFTVTTADLLKGYGDVEGDSLSVSALNVDHASVKDNGNGTFTITPAQDYNGALNLSYHVVDGKGGSIAASQTVNLSSVNDAPVVTGAKANLPYGEQDTVYTVSSADLLKGFSDVEGDTLSVASLSADKGTVVINADGSYTIIPEPGYGGEVKLTYVVRDGQGGETLANQRFGLSPNEAPALTGAPASLAAGIEDTAYTVSASDLLKGYSDVDRGTLAVDNVLAQHATVASNADGSYTITPHANYNGTVTLNYEVVDGQGGSTAATQTITVSAVNDAPARTGVATVLNAGTEDTTYTVTATDLLKGYSDVEGDSLSVNALSADHASVKDNGDGTYTITPAQDYNGALKLSYEVIDGKGGVTLAQSSFSLTGVNDAPGLSSAPAVLATGLEDTAYVFTAAQLLQGYSDVDGGTLSVTDVAASNGSITANANGSYTFTPAANYNGAVTLTYAVRDGQGGSTPAQKTLSLSAVNDAPALTGTKAVLAAGTEDASYTLHAADLLAGYSDAEGALLSVNALVANHGDIIDNQDGTFTLTPAADYNGPVSLTYTVSDGQGGISLAAQTLNINSVNDAPALTDAKAKLPYGAHDTAYTVSAADLLKGFSDVEGDTLSVGSLSADKGTVTDLGNGSYTITPVPGYGGEVKLSYSVRDGQGGETLATQKFGLSPNEAPSLTSAPANLAAGSEDTAYTVTAQDLLKGYSDTDGGTLAVDNVLAQNAAVVANADGSYTITPHANYSGAITLNYEVVDGQGGSTDATQTIAINAVNDAPARTGITAVLAAGTEDTAYTVTAQDLLKGYSDVEGDSLSVSALSADHGSVKDNGNGTFTITPAQDYNGALSLSYQVLDDKGGSIAASQTVSLSRVNDAPVLSETPAQLVDGRQGVSYTISASSLLQGYSDVDGGTLSVAGLSTSQGQIAEGPNNTFTVTVPAGYSGAVTLNYTVLDNQGGSVAATQSFSLVQENHAPVVSGSVIADAVLEDAQILVVDALKNAVDADAGTQLKVVNLPDALPAGLRYDSNSHSFSLDPKDPIFQSLKDGQVTHITVNYGVSDGQATTAASVTFTVTGTNDAPKVSMAAVEAVNEAAYGTTGAGVDIDVASLVTISDADALDSQAPVVAGSLGVVTAVIKDADGHVVSVPVGMPSLSTLFVTTADGHVIYDRADFSFLKTGQHVEAVFGFSAQSGSDTVAQQLTLQIDGITQTYTAKAIDGYVQGATVFYDPTGLGVYQQGYVTGTTDAQGNFSLDLTAQTAIGRIVVMGGVDAMTGQAVGQLLAPTGFGVISPLTTLLTLGNITESQLKASLGITDNIDLATFDPIAAMKGGTPEQVAAGELLFTKQQQVYAVIQSVAHLADAGSAGASLDSLTAAVQAVTSALNSATSPVSMSSLAVAAVTKVLETSSLSADAVVATIAAVSTSIVNATDSIAANYSGLGEALHTVSNSTDRDVLDVANAKIAAAQASAAVSQTQLLTAVEDVQAAAAAATASGNATDLGAITSAGLDTAEVGHAVSGEVAQFKALLEVAQSSAGGGNASPVYLLSQANALANAHASLEGATVLLGGAVGSAGSANNPLSLSAAEALIQAGAKFAVSAGGTLYVEASAADISNLSAAQQNDLIGVLSQLDAAGVQVVQLNGITLTGSDYAAIQAWDVSHTRVSVQASELSLSEVAGDQLADVAVDGAVASISLVRGTSVVVPFTPNWNENFGKVSPSDLAGADVTITGVEGNAVLSVAQTAYVDALTLISGSALELSASQWQVLRSLADKIDQQSLLSATVNVSDVTADEAVALASDPMVSTVSLRAGSSLSLSAAELNSTSKAALEKIAGDVVVTAASTENLLGTSLKELSQLGVDAVAADAGAIGLELGTGTLGQLPSFAAGLDVTLNLDAGQVAEVGAAAGQLAAAGIDHLHINLGDAGQQGYQDDLASLLAGNNLGALDALHNAGLRGTIDLGGANTAGAVAINEGQALSLIADGLQFASNDQITLALHQGAQGTHLGTSLKELQHLGVDTVLSTGHDINVDLGVGGALSAEHMPTFDHSLDVTLNLGAGEYLSEIEAVAKVLADAGIDHIALAQSQLGDLGTDSATHALINAGIDFNVLVGTTPSAAPERLEQVVDIYKNGVDLLSDMLDPNANMGELVKALSQAGVHAIDIDKPASVVIGDQLASALYDAGMLQAMPEAMVEIDAGAAARMQTSLKAMADLGVDHVASSAAAGSHIMLALGTEVQDLASVLQSFISDTDHVSTKSIFDHAVDLYVGTAVGTETLQTLLESGMGSKLADLGISKVVAQDLPPVQVIGAAQENSDPFSIIDITHLKTPH